MPAVLLRTPTTMASKVPFTTKRLDGVLPVALRAKCATTETKQLVLPLTAIPATFTMQLWVRQYACSTQAEEVIVLKPDHFRWSYKVTVKSLSFVLMSQTINAAKFQPLVFEKWIHFTVVNGPVDGFRVLVNGQSLVMSASYISASNAATGPIYLGTDAANSNRFEGNFREFRLWSRELTATEAANNYDRTLIPPELKDVIRYYKLDEGLFSTAVKDTKSKTYISSGTLFDWEVLTEDPVCCRRGKNCAERRWNGIHCTDERKFVYLDGTYFLTLAPITLSAATASLGVSMWFKHVEQPPALTLTPHAYPAVLVNIPSALLVTYNPAYENTHSMGDRAAVTAKDLTGTSEVSPFSINTRPI